MNIKKTTEKRGKKEIHCATDVVRCVLCASLCGSFHVCLCVVARKILQKRALWNEASMNLCNVLCFALFLTFAKSACLCAFGPSHTFVCVCGGSHVCVANGDATFAGKCD